MIKFKLTIEDISYVATDLLTNELSYYEKGNIISALIKVVEKGNYQTEL